MVVGNRCCLQSPNTTQAQGDDIQEHHPTSSFIRQRMLGSTILTHSGASHQGKEEADVDVWRNVV